MKARRVKKSNKTKEKAPQQDQPGHSETKEKKKEKSEVSIATCALKDLSKVLLEDEEGLIKASGKWPMLIDIGGQASTFLRYQDANYLCAANPGDMQEERIRMGLLGGLRYGKPFIIDMLDIEIFDTVSEIFDRIQPGLMQSILSKEIASEENYSKLVKPTDPDDYQGINFNENAAERFKFILLTKIESPTPMLLQTTYPIRLITT